jgi:hypothetical protein
MQQGVWVFQSPFRKVGLTGTDERECNESSMIYNFRIPTRDRNSLANDKLPFCFIEIMHRNFEVELE